jgi:hypothetical protein
VIRLERNPDAGYVSPDDTGEACYSTGSRRVGVNDAEAAILAGGLAGRVVLEIGTGLGVSTRAIASRAKRVCTVDVDPWVIERVHPAINQRNIYTATAILPSDWYNGAFIDGDHRYEAAVRDCREVIARLAPGSPVYMHDYSGQVEKAAQDSGLVFVKAFGTTYDLALCETPRG